MSLTVAHRRPGRRPIVVAPRRRDGGYVLAKFGLLLVPLLLMTGLSVDVGYWYNRAADIQKAADAAALAGVVWLPDVNLAEQNALAAAAKNGFVDGVDDIDVSVTRAGERRLRVVIEDGSVGSFFWSNLGGREIEMSREGLSEYVLPVPMGSPRNYFGTGRLLSGPDQELLYQSVNATCTSKIQGDRHQSIQYNGNTLPSCNSSTPVTNVDYRSRGYELYIEAKQNRPANIDVMLYDPRYNSQDISYQVQTGQNCVTEPVYSPSATTWTTPGSNVAAILAGPAQYQTRANATTNTWSSTTTIGWGQSVSVTDARTIRYRVGATWTPGPITFTTSTSTSSVTITGPAVYQTKSTPTGSLSALQYLADGATYTRERRLIQYRTAVINTNTTCTPVYQTIVDDGLDNNLGGTGSEDERYTFTLFAADNTPLTDDDNPMVQGCQKTYEPSTAFEQTFLGTIRWNVLCSITPSMPTGRYILRVQNEGVSHRNFVDGSNQWGLVAKYSNASGNGLCDGRVDAMCPRVYGRDAISVYANTSAGVASFFLAEIEPEHTGKTLELELWDPGEGGANIQFQKPTGANTWQSVNFNWISYNDDGSQNNSGSGSQVDLRDSSGNDRFNGKLLRIQIPLTNYAPPSNNRWWKIQYTFNSGSVTDRTTWSARVIGDPVHLLEEEAD